MVRHIEIDACCEAGHGDATYVSAGGWNTLLARRSGASKHKLLTEAIIADIEADLLPPRARMTTHRELARRIGVSVQTVSISYKEAERLGYLSGEVGRGTFVRSRITEQADRFMLDRS